jgi:hypothetical protein
VAVTSPKHSLAVEAAIVCALLIAAFAVSLAAMRQFRDAGVKPFFYQANFEPAVMMACGRGFGVASPAPSALTAFLNVETDAFDCAELSTATTAPVTKGEQGTWYYMYVAASATWRMAGVSWRAIDLLVAAMAGAVAALTYGLLRLAGSRVVAMSVALLLVMSPHNLSALLSLRDYSKAPFVLAAILLLAVAVSTQLSRRLTWLLCAAFGAIVAIGYGFRPDLMVLLPFGVMVALFLLPGSIRENLVRNSVAAMVIVAVFAVVASPVLIRLQRGGCQFHFALLGLTTPLTEELQLSSPVYRFGDTLTDEFVDLKVGDHARTHLRTAEPLMCAAEYDEASGDLYARMGTTFPADFVVRAYASVLGILRAGMIVPRMVQPSPPFPAKAWSSPLYATLNGITSLLAPFGLVLTFVAVCLLWAQSPRLAIALAVFVLFLTGYPGIRFEARHWFHLRIIPWWTSIFVLTLLIAKPWASLRADLSKGLLAGVTAVVLLATALAGLRVIQHGRVGALLEQYESAATESVETGPASATSLPVRWPAEDALSASGRASDLLVVELGSANCGANGPVSILTRYEAIRPSYDLSSEIQVLPPAEGGSPTRVFIPVFAARDSEQMLARFTGIEVRNAPMSCVSAVRRLVSRDRLPLTVQASLSSNWRSTGLHQSMRVPGFIRRWLQLS